ncbi:MAG TPA: DUF1553 domain-containing protein [Acidobacteriota bacterium]|jgi:hypothetical protein|nr:DUF1553 domain-containing protein [Acidobacteriota bacterium]
MKTSFISRKIVSTLLALSMAPLNSAVFAQTHRFPSGDRDETAEASVQLRAGKAPFQKNPARLQELRIIPQEIPLSGKGAAHSFLVMGSFSDGLVRDVTSKCKLTISHPELVRVEEKRRVVALSSGTVLLKAELSGRATTASIRIESAPEKEPFSFQREIGTILTRRGCNASECHGGVKGKGGFKLSLDALYPEEDYRWIVQGGRYQVLVAEAKPPVIPRVDVKQPEESLLLLKPTLTVPHGGGQRFEDGSKDYQTILEWVRKRAPFDEPGAERRRAERVEIHPAEVFLERGESQQLLLTAQLVSGRKEDWTGRVRFSSNNPDVVEVTPDGRLQARSPGEAVITLRTPGHVISKRIGVIDRVISNYPRIPGRNLIDNHVFAKLHKLHILPSELSSDSEFLRRICLDLTGMLPPSNRVREFLQNKDPQKRDRLIQTLMESPEYVDYWTFRFSDPLRVALSAVTPYSTTKAAQRYSEWIRSFVELNKAYDQMARERIAAQGSDGASRHFRHQLPSETMAEEVKMFMGRRLDCAQCHNHPAEPWSQNQFWQMTSFFGRLGYIFNPFMDWVLVVDISTGTGMFGADDPVTNPRTKQAVQPAFLNGRGLTEDEQKDPRMALAKWMTSHPYFAEAAVNRIWSFIFGKGLVEPVDDFRSTNPPTHPELLQALAQDFREHGHDVRHLIRLIVQSRTYQLSAVPNETNRNDKLNYSHALPRRLDTEVLLDAISAVSGVPELFEGRHRTTAGGREPLGVRAVQLKESDSDLCSFLDAYGRPDRSAIPERDHKPNLVQALHRLAGSTYTDKLARKGGRIDQLIQSGASDRDIIQELILVAFSRFPTGTEREELQKKIGARALRREALEDLVWGLINSREFVYNH